MHINTRFVLSLLAAIPTVFAVNGKCANGRNGICIATGTCSNYGGRTSNGNCPRDGNNIKCCENISCNVNGESGSCMFANECSGTTYSGKCPGGSDFKCCIKKNPNAGVGTSCSDGNRHGTCINTNSSGCNGDLVSGKCPGAANIKCCLPHDLSGVGKSCSNGSRSGTCINTNSSGCNGDLVSGKCPGASFVKCCLPHDLSGVGKSCSDGSKSGTCINTNSSGCNGNLVSGKCPGASFVKCCIPPGPDLSGVGKSCTSGSRSGTCINTSTNNCNGDLVTGKCPGDAMVKCCLPHDLSGVGKSCSDGSRSGTCINTNTGRCNGNLVSGKCPGASFVKCCLPSEDLSGVGKSCSDGSRSGTCINTKTNSCSGDLISGKCPGSTNVKCCLPPAVGTKCKNNKGVSGTCIDTNATKCNGSLASGLCPGGNNVKCCLEGSIKETGVGEKCKSDQGLEGTCININTTKCGGSLITGKCPGGNNVKCCIGDGTGVGKVCSSGGRSGTCINTNANKCDGELVSGLCPGANNIKCCLKSSGNDQVGVGKSCSSGTRSGICINTNTNKCNDGEIVSGLCPGGNNVKCCLNKNDSKGVGTRCSDGNANGTCIDVNSSQCSSGNIVTGKCPGGNNVKCCLDAPLTNESGVGTKCNYGGKSGICIDVDKTQCKSSNVISGRCPGPNNVRCCLEVEEPEQPEEPLNNDDDYVIGQHCSDGSKNGVCINYKSSRCPSDHILSDLCPGSDNIQCCMLEEGQDITLSNEDDSNAIGAECSIEDLSGICINLNTSSCHIENIYYGLCPGGDAIQCCVTKKEEPPSDIGKTCSSRGINGICIDTNETPCKTYNVDFNACSGGDNIGCCLDEEGKPEPEEGVGAKCSKNGVNGTCIDINQTLCPTYNIAYGECPGNDNVQCCLEKEEETPETSEIPKDPETVVGLKCSSQGINGICIDTNETPCKTYNVDFNACSGGDNIGCCLDEEEKPEPEEGVGAKCSKDGVNGTCIDINQTLCPTYNVAYGECLGNDNVQCCLEEEEEIPETSENTEIGVGEKCSRNGVSGTCIDISQTRCETYNVAYNICSSGNVQCCLDEPSEETQYNKIILDASLLKQANYPNEFTTGCTISKEGSCITSITMALNQIHSLNYTPYDVAKKMNFFGCDADYSSYSDLDFVNIYQPDLSVILESLVNGNSVPYCGLSGGHERWVTVYGYTGDYDYNSLKSSDFLIYDPETNKTTLRELLKSNEPFIALIYNYYYINNDY